MRRCININIMQDGTRVGLVTWREQKKITNFQVIQGEHIILNIIVYTILCLGRGSSSTSLLGMLLSLDPEVSVNQLYV